MRRSRCVHTHFHFPVHQTFPGRGILICSSLLVSQVVLMLSSLSITGSDFPQKIPLEAARSVPLVVPVRYRRDHQPTGCAGSASHGALYLPVLASS